MSRKYRLAPALLVGILVASASGAAADVQLVQDDRVLTSIGQSCDEFSCDPPFNHRFTPPAPFAPWSIAGQSSTVTPQQMQGSGSGSSYSDIGWSQSTSVYEVVFDVDVLTDAHLQGDLSTDILWGWPEAGVRLSGPFGSVYELVINDSSYEDGAFDELALLLPGQYVIRVWADGGVPIADAWFDFSLDLSPATSCGLGPELALLLPLLWSARRRD